MKIRQDLESRRRPAPLPPPSLSFSGFEVATFDGFVDVPEANPTLMYRRKALKSAEPKANHKAWVEVPSSTKPRDKTARTQSNIDRVVEPARLRTAIQRVNSKLKQLKDSDVLMSQLRMRVATIKSSKPVFELEKVEANLNVAAALERREKMVVQHNEKRKNRVAAIVEAARESELLQRQQQQEMEAKQEFRSKAKERFLQNQARMNTQSRQTLLLTACAVVVRSWWWLRLGHEQICLTKTWIRMLKAQNVLRKCAKMYLWKLFLRKKSQARRRLIMWLPEKARRWKLNRYTQAVNILKVSFKEYLRCYRYKILARMFLTRMYRIQKNIRFACLRRLAQAECNWMILQNHLKSLKDQITNDEQLDANYAPEDQHEERQPGQKRLHWLLKEGELGAICSAMGPGECLASIVEFLSRSHKAYILSINEWKDTCVKKRKLGFKWMPPRPRYKFLMTLKEIEQAVKLRAHDLLYEREIEATTERIARKKREKGPKSSPNEPT